MHDARAAFADAYLMLSCLDPVQAADRADLRDKLRVAGGGVVFTTRSWRCGQRGQGMSTRAPDARRG